MTSSILASPPAHHEPSVKISLTANSMARTLQKCVTSTQVSNGKAPVMESLVAPVRPTPATRGPFLTFDGRLNLSIRGNSTSRVQARENRCYIRKSFYHRLSLDKVMTSNRDCNLCNLCYLVHLSFHLTSRASGTDSGRSLKAF
jgi:hypothetical protein